MKVSKSGNNLPKEDRKLRNFDFSVEEIRIIKTIKDMTQSLKKIELKNTQSARLEIFRHEIRRLEIQLEEIRENTLMR